MDSLIKSSHLQTNSLFNALLIEGAGNTFILLHSLDPFFSISQKAIEILCLKNDVDGFLLITPHVSSDCTMQYYNRDGNEAGMCGNGLRCTAFYLGTISRTANEHNHLTNTHSIATAKGIRNGFSDNNSATVEMGIVHFLNEYRLKDMHGSSWTFSLFDSGVPHAIALVKDITDYDLSSIGPYFRYHESFAPAGTNISLIQIESDTKLLIRTYERGVEAETGACGTAACAAASFINPQQKRTFQIIPTSKNPLFVTIIPSEDGNMALLKGPCTIFGYLDKTTLETLHDRRSSDSYKSIQPCCL